MSSLMPCVHCGLPAVIQNFGCDCCSQCDHPVEVNDESSVD